MTESTDEAKQDESLCQKPLRATPWLPWEGRASKRVMPLVMMATLVGYSTALWIQSLAEVATISLGAIGILLGLSAVCFTFSPSLADDSGKNASDYAAEKFLHSSVLIVQVLFLKFAITTIVSYDGGEGEVLKWIKVPVYFLGSLLGNGISAYAAYTAAWGFNELNDLLWHRYGVRKARSMPKSRKI